jgi:hypothetical protein
MSNTNSKNDKNHSTYTTQEEYNRLISINDSNINNEIYSDNVECNINNVCCDDNENQSKTNEMEFDLNDYEIPKDDNNDLYFDIINIFNVYFKTLFNRDQNSTLFDGINSDDPCSTNRAMETLYEEIHRFKSCQNEKYIKLYDPTEYRDKYLISGKLDEDYPFYMVKLSNSEKVTHNLITAISYIASFNWKECDWEINQINEF